MKSFLKINITLFVFLFLLLACEDNFEVDDTEITLEEPTELESTLVNGRVTNEDGDPLANAEIKIFHGDKPIDLMTDGNGHYEIELPADNSKILIQATNEDYIASAIDKRTLEGTTVVNDIKMLSKAGSSYPDQAFIINPNDTATLSGRVLALDGTPAVDAVVLLLDFRNLIVKAYDYTDANGDYSFTAAPFDDLVLYVFQNCGAGEVINDDVDLGTQDIDVGTFTAASLNGEQIVFSGFVTDCNTGQGLTKGSVNIQIDTNGGQFYPAIIRDGNYSVTVNNCVAATCYNVRVESDLYANTVIEESCLPITGNAISADYNFCGTIAQSEGSIRLLVGTDSLIFDENVVVDEDVGIVIAGTDATGNRSVAMLTLEQGNGTHPLSYFAISVNSTLVVSHTSDPSVPTGVDIVVDRTNDEIFGTVNGSVVDDFGNIVEVSGTYRAKL